MTENPQTVVTMGGWSGRAVLYAALGCLLLGAILGAWGYHTATHSDWLTKLHDLEKLFGRR